MRIHTYTYTYIVGGSHPCHTNELLEQYTHVHMQHTHTHTHTHTTRTHHTHTHAHTTHTHHTHTHTHHTHTHTTHAHTTHTHTTHTPHTRTRAHTHTHTHTSKQSLRPYLCIYVHAHFRQIHLTVTLLASEVPTCIIYTSTTSNYDLDVECKGHSPVSNHQVSRHAMCTLNHINGIVCHLSLMLLMYHGIVSPPAYSL